MLPSIKNQVLAQCFPESPPSSTDRHSHTSYLWFIMFWCGRQTGVVLYEHTSLYSGYSVCDLPFISCWVNAAIIHCCGPAHSRVSRWPVSDRKGHRPALNTFPQFWELPADNQVRFDCKTDYTSLTLSWCCSEVWVMMGCRLAAVANLAGCHFAWCSLSLCPYPLSHYPSVFVVLLSPGLRQHVVFLPGSSVCMDRDDSEVWRQCFWTSFSQATLCGSPLTWRCYLIC